VKDRGTIAGAVMNKAAYAALIILSRHIFFSGYETGRFFRFYKPEGCFSGTDRKKARTQT